MTPEEMDGIHTAWTIIANAHDWFLNHERDKSQEWVEAAIRWRDDFYYQLLDRYYESEEDTDGL